MYTPLGSALLSVSDKSGLTELGQALSAAQVKLFASGGTYRHLLQAGLEVTEISAYTGSPEMMDGRVKTLHPKVHGGILCRRDVPEDLAAATTHGIELFDLVVVNLYPFAATIARDDATPAECVEQIDIGGPTLVRAAAKNHPFVAIATSPAQYAAILSELTTHGGTSLALRQQLAAAAFAHTAAYDAAVAAWCQQQFGMAAPTAIAATAADPTAESWPEKWPIELRLQTALRYGENPHQRAALYADASQGDLLVPSRAAPAAPGGTLVTARQLRGKELSYNNLLDLSSALAMVRSVVEPAVVVIKHNNPCGAATAATLADATRHAMEGDPTSAFGSVLGMNREIDLATAEYLATPGLFVEAILAPAFAPEALEVLSTRPKWRSNVRLMEVGPLAASGPEWDLRRIDGGFLVQQADERLDDETEWRIVTDAQPDAALLADLRFAWHMVRYVKSNAIVLVRDRTLVGVGAGQMSRVDSTRIAIEKAGARADGSVLGSDAFFPFADSVEVAAAAGVQALIQPGGSKNDPDVIAACNRLKLPMVFTGQRHFRH